MKLKQVVRNTRHVLAIELLTATRALDCLRPLNSSPVIEQVRAALAKISAPWTADRSLTADIENTSAWIASGACRALLNRDVERSAARAQSLINTSKLVTVRYPIASYKENPDDVACSTVRDTPRVCCACWITWRMMASANPSRRCCGSVATE